MTQDEQNLNLLSIFHYVVAGLTALFACVFLVHVGIGIAMLTGALDAHEAPPRFMGWLFIIIPGTFILAAWTLAVFMVIAGRKLRRRVSRTFCLVVGGIECALCPFGTVLGVFTIVVLMKESVKALFANGGGAQSTG
jgi:hypothetical protein